MVALAFLQLLNTVISVILLPLGGIVEELPFGMQPAVDLFAGTLNSVFAVAPFIEVPFSLIMWAIGIKIALLVLNMLMWIIARVR